MGISTAVEFLRKKGCEVEENPNAKITDEEFELLRQEFSTDKDLKAKSNQFILGRKEKDKKPSVAIKGYEPAPVKEKQKFKQVGRIDLDKVGKPAKVTIVEEEKPAMPQPTKVDTKPQEETVTKPVNIPAEQEIKPASNPVVAKEAAPEKPKT